MAKLFNKKKTEIDPTKERNEKLVPIAQAIIKLIAEMDLPVGTEIHAHDNAKFTSAAKNVLGEMLEKDVKYVDKDFLFQLVLQPFDNVLQIVKKSLDESFNSAESKLFGKGYREITLGDLDRVLTDKKLSAD